MPKIILTIHAAERLIQRGITIRDAKYIGIHGIARQNTQLGIIIKSGRLINQKMLNVATRRKGQRIVIITAYYDN